jgi:hypothetical protein
MTKKTLRQVAAENLADITPEIKADEILRLVREVGPKNGRQQAILNAIDERLLGILTAATATEKRFNPSSNKIENVEVTNLTEGEQVLAECCTLLSLLLREAWTYS